MSSINNIIKKLRENRILNEREDYNKYSRDELIELAQEGDQLALELLVKSHQDMIINMSKKYNVDIGDFDDIKQMITIAFWEAVMSWDMTGNFEAYAGMLIKRKMADYLRTDGRGKTQINTKADRLDTPAGEDEEGGEMTLGATLKSKDLSPEEMYLSSEGIRAITNFMENNLSEIEREVIKKYIAGYKVSEISEEMKVKYKSVENAIMRVKNKLADYMRNSYKESRKLRDSKVVEFTDEEKQVLKSILSKIDEKKKMNESDTLNDIYNTKDWYDYKPYDDLLDTLEGYVYDLSSSINGAYRRDAKFYIRDAEKILDIVKNIDDLVSDSQYPRLEKIASDAKEVIRIGEEQPYDDRDEYDDYVFNAHKAEKYNS